MWGTYYSKRKDGVFLMKNGEKKMTEKTDKHFGDIVGSIIGIMGIIVTIICSLKNINTALGCFYVCVLATESLLVMIWGWNLSIQNRFQKKEIELQKGIEKEIEKYNSFCLQVEKDKESLINERIKDKKNISTIIASMKNASKLNNELCNRIPEINEKAYHLLETLQREKCNTEAVESELQKSHEEFSIGLFDLFKRYTSNLINYVIASMEAYLKVNDLSCKIAVAVKLFDKPLLSDGNKDNVLVYTAFRDKNTYDEHKREIGEETYSILGNADFVQCLTKDHFIINNADKNNLSYTNEHVDFELYYNCAVVVPIRVKQGDGSMKILGYLCCDALNDNLEKIIFDKESAQLLFSLAQLYATFLETLNSNWIDRMQDNKQSEKHFLELICKKTYIGKKR